jgi:hypothetical protein
MDYQAIKRSRLKMIQGQETINQVEHLAPAGAKIVTSGVIVPGKVVATDTSAAPVLIGIGSILRIEVTADTYLAFGDETLAAVTVTTSPAIKLKPGITLVCATDDFVRTSAALTRLEVIEVL